MYKRQQQNYDLIYLKEGMVADAGNVVEEMFEDLYARLLDDLLHGDESSPVFRHPVSYTHLDVYKRQRLVRPRTQERI